MCSSFVSLLESSGAAASILERVRTRTFNGDRHSIDSRSGACVAKPDASHDGAHSGSSDCGVLANSGMGQSGTRPVVSVGIRGRVCPHKLHRLYC